MTKHFVIGATHFVIGATHGTEGLPLRDRFLLFFGETPLSFEFYSCGRALWRTPALFFEFFSFGLALSFQAVSTVTF